MLHLGLETAEYTIVAREARIILDLENIKISNQQLSKLCYYCVLFGPHLRGQLMLKSQLTEFDPRLTDKLLKKLRDKTFRIEMKKKYSVGYLPFCGHLSRIGHYYRHLYQTITYIDQQSFSSKKKYEYAKTIRAQLSHHEQALLLINSLTPIGKNWWGKNFIINYRLVKNIPKGFFKKREIDLSKKFPPGYFEWEENNNSIH